MRRAFLNNANAEYLFANVTHLLTSKSMYHDDTTAAAWVGYAAHTFRLDIIQQMKEQKRAARMATNPATSQPSFFSRNQIIEEDKRRAKAELEAMKAAGAARRAAASAGK